MSHSFGLILLALFLIVYGVLAVTNITFAFQAALLGFLAIGAGVLLLIGK